MSEKATASDAQLILQLYDLRREPEMRKARHWWMTEFWPRNAEDFSKVGMAMGTQENAWLRQVSSYWGMVASLVLAGAVNEELFLQPSISGEMFFVFAKVHPFLNELREKFNEPQMFLSIEKVITRTEFGQNRLQGVIKRVEALREKMTAAGGVRS